MKLHAGCFLIMFAFREIGLTDIQQRACIAI